MTKLPLRNLVVCELPPGVEGKVIENDLLGASEDVMLYVRLYEA